MDITKLHESKQPLLHRTVAAYRVVAEGATPSRVQVVQSLSSKEKGTVVVKHVYTRAGEQAALVHAHVYSDEKTAPAVERANLLAKQQPKAAPAEAQ